MNKIQNNRPEISSDEIQQFKNFDAVIRQWNAPRSPHFHPGNKWFNGIVGVSILSVVFLMAYLVHSHKKPLISQCFVNPPVPAWDVPYVKSMISNKRDTLLQFASGTTLFIEKESFSDDFDKPVYDSIELLFREFPSPAEIFLSGIPMEYDHDGVKSVFESSGMVEVKGFRRDKQIKIKQGKSIEVNLFSSKPDKGYQLYYLDTVSRKWAFQGPDLIALKNNKKIKEGNNEVKSNALPREGFNRKSFNLNGNIANQQSGRNTNTRFIQLDLTKGEFPEMEVFENNLFEVDEQYKPLNANDASKVWEDVKVFKASSSFNYYLVFKNKKDSCRYLVHPVLGKSNKIITDSLFLAYQQLWQNRDNGRKSKSDTVGNKTKMDKKYLVFEKSNAATTSEETILRSFKIQQFGIWNCDQVRIIANERTIEPILIVNDTVFRQISYLVDDKATSLNRIYPGSALKFDEKANNTLWMVTYNNKIAIYFSEEFKSLPKTNPRCRLNMHVLKTAVKDAGDFIRLYKNGFRE